MKKIIIIYLAVLNIFCNFICSQSLEEQITAITSSIQKDYHTLHQYPELGLREFRTAQFVRNRLQEMGYETFFAIEKLPTAVITVLDTQKAGPVICIRSELDALKIQEKTNLEFASKIDGVMHACGHDAHIAILLGTADILRKRKDSLTGKIVFLFQPAEEIKGGAEDIVESGILDQLKVESIFTLHVAPDLPVGVILLSPGPMLAGSYYFTITVAGKESHPAFPHQGNDVLVAAANLVCGLTNLPARRLDVTNQPCVISITSFQSGDGMTNKIPATAILKGTIRSYENIEVPANPNTSSIRQIIETYIHNIANTYGVSATLDLKKGSPPTVNNEELYYQALKIHNLWPSLQIRPGTKVMAAEDFAYYCEKYPCLSLGLGVARENLGYRMLHQNDFTIHEDALSVGVQLWVRLAEIINSNLDKNNLRD